MSPYYKIDRLLVVYYRPFSATLQFLPPHTKPQDPHPSPIMQFLNTVSLLAVLLSSIVSGDEQQQQRQHDSRRRTLLASNNNLRHNCGAESNRCSDARNDCLGDEDCVNGCCEQQAQDFLLEIDERCTHDTDCKSNDCRGKESDNNNSMDKFCFGHDLLLDGAVVEHAPRLLDGFGGFNSNPKVVNNAPNDNCDNTGRSANLPLGTFCAGCDSNCKSGYCDLAQGSKGKCAELPIAAAGTVARNNPAIVLNKLPNGDACAGDSNCASKTCNSKSHMCTRARAKAPKKKKEGFRGWN